MRKENSEFHQYEKKLENLIRRIKGISTKGTNGKWPAYKLTEKNRKKLLEYYESLYSSGARSISRKIRIMSSTAQLFGWLEKDFDLVEKEDLVKLIVKISSKKYSPHTIMMFKVSIKQFWKWLYGEDEYPKLVRFIKCTVKHNEKKLPEDLYSEEDIKKILSVCENPMNAALLAVTYESGARIGEIGNARIGSLEFKDIEATIVLNGKTGSRKVLLLMSVPYLKEWLSFHPGRDNKNSSLFVLTGNVNKGSPLTYGAARKIFRNSIEKAGINKAFNPHIFRHSRATFLAKYLNEAQLCEVFGWKYGSSDSPSVYVSLSQKQIYAPIKKIYGIKVDEEEDKSKLIPKNCEICNHLNKLETEICFRCSNPLSMKGMLDKMNSYKLQKDVLDSMPKDVIFKILDDWWSKKQGMTNFTR